MWVSLSFQVAMCENKIKVLYLYLLITCSGFFTTVSYGHIYYRYKATIMQTFQIMSEEMDRCPIIK